MKTEKYEFLVTGNQVSCSEKSARWLVSQIGGAMGKMKSKKKSASSKKNGKLGGRPKKNNNNQDAQ